jgi:hypothetical protein
MQAQPDNERHVWTYILAESTVADWSFVQGNDKASLADFEKQDTIVISAAWDD